MVLTVFKNSNSMILIVFLSGMSVALCLVMRMYRVANSVPWMAEARHSQGFWPSESGLSGKYCELCLIFVLN